MVEEAFFSCEKAWPGQMWTDGSRFGDVEIPEAVKTELEPVN